MHELGHVVLLTLLKLPIISIYIPFISIHVGDKIKYKMSSSWESKGLVIPDVPIINKQSDFIHLKELYVKFLQAGPIATIIFYCIELYVLLCMQYFCTGFTNYLVILILHTSIQTFFLLQNCFKELDNNIGDIVAAERVKKDDFFFASYVYCCYFFSENYKIKIKSSTFIKSIIKENILNLSDDHLICEVELLDEIIYRSVSGLDDFYNELLNEMIYSIVNLLFDSMNNPIYDKKSIVSAYLHALMYIITVQNNSNKALQLYNNAQDYLPLDNPMCKYLNYEIRYLLNLETDKPKEIYPVTEYENWSHYKQYYVCENAILCRRQT